MGVSVSFTEEGDASVEEAALGFTGEDQALEEASVGLTGEEVAVLLDG